MSAKPTMGRPRSKGALRRTGKALHVLMPADELEAAKGDAARAGMSLAAYVRMLLHDRRIMRGY